MMDRTQDPETDWIKASELYVAARELEAQKRYMAALKRYRQSLELHEDETVRKAYLNILAVVGPD